MCKSLTFIFIVFVMAKFYFKKFCFKKVCMKSPPKIVINVGIGMPLTWKFQKTFKTKFGSVKNIKKYYFTLPKFFNIKRKTLAG